MWAQTATTGLVLWARATRTTRAASASVRVEWIGTTAAATTDDLCVLSAQNQ